MVNEAKLEKWFVLVVICFECVCLNKFLLYSDNNTQGHIVCVFGVVYVVWYVYFSTAKLLNHINPPCCSTWYGHMVSMCGQRWVELCEALIG